MCYAISQLAAGLREAGAAELLSQFFKEIVQALLEAVSGLLQQVSPVFLQSNRDAAAASPSSVSSSSSSVLQLLAFHSRTTVRRWALKLWQRHDPSSRAVVAWHLLIGQTWQFVFIDLDCHDCCPRIGMLVILYELCAQSLHRSMSIDIQLQWCLSDDAGKYVLLALNVCRMVLKIDTNGNE